ncbi:putative transcriptional regulator protein [Rhizobium etli CFN 42]|uniref:Transcriptional regulator protein n=2 Tax=Rhizobium etli TaxID=29449 RepID=Q2KBE9_RHIEC|nr:helix-turn-helix domain-containing protein [Rhizobium etli]ABC89837.1 putative transcriptional regulator protein [Rhizobium etli CFN 42]AGS20897.1 HxlR family transcriptional regulator protein [Rhizobium etli bv. mimosae str. Mim1]ARQ09137.1 HxlR family transcriptional regulator protein [Rhizobium etli]
MNTTAATQAGDLPASEDHNNCRALGQILDRVGDKWTIMVVGVLSRGPLRFNQMMREIGGVSHRMLTLTLRSLERDGLVSRTAYATIPPKVEYALTDAGRSLIEPLRVLSDWAIDYRPVIEKARADFDTRGV